LAYSLDAWAVSVGDAPFRCAKFQVFFKSIFSDTPRPMPPAPMAATISYVPRRVPGPRGMCCMEEPGEFQREPPNGTPWDLDLGIWDLGFEFGTGTGL